MRLVVFSHKVCWRSAQSPTGWATDGGFVFHMQSLASAYDETVLIVPVVKNGKSQGEVWFTDDHIKVIPLREPFGSGISRKLLFPFWFLTQLPKFISQISKADVIHAPIPGDIGTIGMLLGPLFRKKLFIRYCGNWLAIKTPAEKFWAWYGEKFTGKLIAFFCTGGSELPPSHKNPALKWIFSSSMLKSELEGYPQKKFDFSKEFNLVMGGRLIEEKGFGILIDAVGLLKTKIPNINVSIFGDGPGRKSFEQQVDAKGLREKIKFFGKLNSNEVHQLLSAADVFCFPTYSSEGFPKVVIEAMAHSLPVISTPVSVIPFLINSERPAGLLVEKKNTRQLADQIGYYFDNPSIHLIHSKNAKQISMNYSLENWVDTINNNLNKQWNTEICRLRDIKK